MKESRVKGRLDITEEVIELIRLKVKEFASDRDIDELGLYPKRISRAIVEIVHDVALQQHPLDYKHTTSLVTGYDEKTIYRIVDKS